MRLIQNLLLNYVESHQNLTNSLIHYECLTAIFILLLAHCIKMSLLQNNNDFFFERI